MYPEAGSHLFRLVEAVLEAAVAYKGIPILSSEYSGTGTHQERRMKFHQHWLGSKSPFSTEERKEIAETLVLFQTDKREKLLYVDYATAKPPTMKEKEFNRLLSHSRRLYRIVRRHLDPLP
jgi:alpha-galactosidase